METTRRQSVSELNLEEILLAMADSDTPQASNSFSTMKPRPLPTPQARPRLQPEMSTLPQPISYPNHDPYHSQYPAEIEHNHPPMDESFYSMGYPSHPQQVMYPYEQENYVYQPDPSHDGTYFGSEQEYSYSEPYMYPPEQGYGEYYQEYAYPYYAPEQNVMPYTDYYYPYGYQNQDYSYSQQYYHEEPQPIHNYDATVNPGFSTTRKPLPRLPPKKKREELTPSHDLTFGTPSIDSSHHLGLFPQQQDMTVAPPSSNSQQHIEKPATYPPPQREVSQNHTELVDSPENLAAIMADISLHFSNDNSKPPKIATPSRGPSLRETELKTPSRSSSINHAEVTNSQHEQLNAARASSVPTIPNSPAPPPRLSKEAAALRLSSSTSCVSSPLVGNSSKDTRSHIPTSHSHLSQVSSTAKASMRSTTNARAFKKGPSRLTPNKPQNVVQLLNLSKPVTDSDADGFDFDETDFESIDRAVLTMSTPPECSLEQLVREHLIISLRADWARIRAIFIWIVENIRYDTQLIPAIRGPSPNMLSSSDEDSDDDHESNFSQSIESEDELGDGEEYHETPKAVLLRRACRQHGFANLFKAMCASAGLECEIISGYLKDPNDGNELNKIPEANHSWICVKIQGYYRFIDCGLAVSSHPYNINKKTDLFYFLTNPSKLIYTHFPTNKVHQYLRPAIPFASFALLPFATDTYFDYGIRFLDLPDGVLTIHEDQTGEINLSIPDEMKCWGEVEIPDPSGRGVRRLPALVQCRTKEEGRVAKVMIRIKGKSSSALLRFRCGYPQDGKLLPYCFSLRLAHTGIKAPEEFVKILPSPAEFFLVDPLNFDLLYNIAYRFHVLPGAVESKHFKLALRSPSMKIHKFVYYPGDQGYIANVTLRERGQWAISYMVQSKEERPSKREPWINVACYRCI